MSALADLSTEDLLDLKSVMSVLHLPAEAGELDMSLQPRGYRLLSKIPRLPDAVIGSASCNASATSRRSCVPPSTTSTTSRASAAPAPALRKDGLSRLAETSILDRYS